MTLTATWIAGDPGSDQLWMASDSRISDAHGRLIDEGAKLYELPIVSRSPSAAGFFDEQTFGTTVGLLCAGSTLIFQQVYSTLVPTLGNLIGTNSIPTLEEVAQFVGRMTTLYTRSFGENRPRQARVSLVVGGRDPITGKLAAYELAPDLDSDGLISFNARAVDFEGDQVLFTGDLEAIGEATSRLEIIRAAPAPGRPYERAALNVIRELALDERYATVGGDVQIGCTTGSAFRRFATISPLSAGQPAAQMKLNDIDLEALGNVGPCAVGISGMISP